MSFVRDAQEFEVEDTLGFTAGFVATALGVKFCPDFGAGGPFPEQFFELLVGGGFEQGEPFLLFREVPFGDGGAGEFVGEDRFGFRQGVEPGEDFGTGHAVVEGLVELLADRARETGDFADTIHSFWAELYRGHLDKNCPGEKLF